MVFTVRTNVYVDEVNYLVSTCVPNEYKVLILNISGDDMLMLPKYGMKFSKIVVFIGLNKFFTC